MASLDSLPADQRAVLQLVLQRGRSYDEIARLLSIDRAAVRERALTAFDVLGPQTGLADQRRGLITDYLLGQLPPAVADQTRDRLAESPSERAWARVLASELAPLAKEPLPEIPVEGSSPRTAPDAEEPAAEPDPPVAAAIPPATEPAPPPADPVTPDIADPDAGEAAGGIWRWGRRDRGERKPKAAKAKASRARAPKAQTPTDEPPGPPRTSRVGGSVLIAAAAVVAIVVVVVLLTSGGSGSKKTPTTAASASSTTSATSTASGSSTTGTGSTAAKVIAQINLTPTVAGSTTAGIAEVLKEGTTDGVAIVAQHVTPNTTKPPNAYAVWLYNSATDAHLLGFVNPAVTSNGRLSTAGGLPSNASHYKELIVTLETKATPTTPGTIILQGALTGL
jgi:hypothetical protein